MRRAFAKVNLGLAITGRRGDGYHELRSVFLRIGMSDRLEATLAVGVAVDLLTVSGDDDCPVDGNIVLRALALLRHSVPAGNRLPPLALALRKEIPVGGGLGGGSSDGAAALDLAAYIWDLELASGERDRVAALLGADVPFFVANHPLALVSGIGDRLSPLPPIRDQPALLLMTPTVRLSTAEVFAQLDRLGTPGSASGQVVDDLAAAIKLGLPARSLVNWAARLRDANDLWPAAVSLQPRLERLRSELEQALDRPFLLTGSGSTLFALYPSLAEARDAGMTLMSSTPAELEGATIFAAGTGIHNQPEALRIQ